MSLNKIKVFGKSSKNRVYSCQREFVTLRPKTVCIVAALFSKHSTSVDRSADYRRPISANISQSSFCALQYLARNFILRLTIRNFVSSVIPKYQRHCWMVSVDLVWNIFIRTLFMSPGISSLCRDPISCGWLSIRNPIAHFRRCRATNNEYIFVDFV